MSDNSQMIFNQAMQQGDAAAWDSDWEAAIQAYMTALRQYPSSPLACNSLGYALYQAGRLEEALRVFGQSQKLDPDDPLPVEKSADVLERMGRAQDAARQYLNVAEIYLGQHDLVKAIDNWRRATDITPGLLKIHQKLAMAYERTGQRAEAIYQYMQLATQFQQANRNDIALQALERALRLDSKNPNILNAITAVRANREISPNLVKAPAPDGSNTPQDTPDAIDDLLDVADAHESGPIGDAVELALEQLATNVFESGMMDATGASAIQAIEMHRAGFIEEALPAYQQALKAGMNTPALHMNLGVLLVEDEQYDAALASLSQIKDSHVLEAGARHAISYVYIATGRWQEAAEELIDTLRHVELSLVLDEDEADELRGVYNKLRGLVGQSDGQTLENFSIRLFEMLTGADWKRRVVQTRNRLEDLLSKDAKHALEDIAKGETVMEAMHAIDKFIDQRRYNIAMDEAHRIVEKEPDYLVAHLRIAQILMDQNRIEQGIVKYNWIARTYMIRGDEHKAAEILNEVIKIAPADINLRMNLIELLEQQEQWDQVLHQYLELGKAYRDLADLGNARMTYAQALKLAKQREASMRRQLEIMHRLAQIDLERIELRSALRTYQEIVDFDKSDMVAYRQMVDLNYRLNNPVQALKVLDHLLQLYAKQKRGDLILEVLEQETQEHPKELGLRARLGSVYQQMKKRAAAIEQFEALRKLQTDAGLHDEARQTIKRIISLNPPGVEQYQQLLQQMGG